MLEQVNADIDLQLPDSAAAAPVEGKPRYGEDFRRHGCQQPYSTGQMMTWCGMVVFVLSFVLLISPVAFSADRYSKEYVVPTLLFLALAFVVLASATYATIHDPTDSYLLGRHVPVDRMTSRIKENIFQSVPTVHRLKWCDLCEWVIDEKSAHCISCRRCTYNVSHHCWFVNNCIGQGNYAAFITLLCSALLLTLVEFVLSIKVIWLVSKNPTEFDLRWSSFYGLDTSYSRYHSSKLIVAPFMVVLLLLLIGAMTFILQFLSFQITLKLQGMTMLQYVSRNDPDAGAQEGPSTSQ